MPPLLVERVRTSGIFSLDGNDYQVENNIWLVGDSESVLVIDAAHDADPINAAIGDRRVPMIVCTHGHNDHINAAADLAAMVRAPIALHPDDGPLWRMVYAGRSADLQLSDGDTIDIAGDRWCTPVTATTRPLARRCHTSTSGYCAVIEAKI